MNPHAAVMPSPLALLALLLQAAAPQPTPAAPVGARDPAFAPDGRLAVSVDGDLWVRDARGERWTRLTSGAAWDRQPSWTRDGRAVLFASDRERGFDIWRVSVDAAGGAGAPERVTTSPEPEGSPAALADGSIVFVRGRANAARLWTRTASGEERRLASGEAAELDPAASPDGRRVAYVRRDESGASLRIRTVGETRDSVVLAERAAAHPAWSPDGARLSFFSTTPSAGVYVAPLDGAYANLAASGRARAVWSPDGRRLVLAEIPPDPPGYNGDPDRIGDRDVAVRLGAAPALREVDAPPAPDAGASAVSVSAARPRAERNLDAFDRAWERTARAYFAGAEASVRRAEWERLRGRYRGAAERAESDAALEEVLHEMWRARPPLREAARGRAAVSSAHPLATAAGVEILARGGNVVDAAVAVSFALGVVEPDASGVGGYGQMLVDVGAMREPALVEFMSRAPEDAGLDNGRLLQDGRYPADGPVLANVPGTVAAMHLAWRRWGSGKVKWAELLAPAVRLARDGFPVSDGLATTLATERDHFAKYESSRTLFFRDGRPLAAGDTLRNPDLAWTLERIAEGGADAFYRGEVARRMVADLRGQGNAMRLTDLARYYAAERAPVSGTYRGHTLYSSAPPASGGASLVSTLAMLERHAAPKPYAEDAPTLHAMVAAWQLVPTTRGRIADPGLWPTTLEPFTSRDTARARWRCFDPSRALSAEAIRGDSAACGGRPAPAAAPASEDPSGSARIGLALDERPGCESHEHAENARACHAAGTTAFVVADADGNVVTVTQTLGTWGGNFYVSPGLGFIYNDKLTSYPSDPSAYGARLPFARHGSTLAPTIVYRGEGERRRPVLALGAAGNQWITSAVYQTLVGVIDQGLDPQRALELPRFFPSQRGAGARREVVLDVESGLAPQVRRRLEAMGYTLRPISLPGELRMGYGAAIAIGAGQVTAGADPRRSGTAGAVP